MAVKLWEAMLYLKELKKLKVELERFASRVAEVTQEKEITSDDFNLFKALGFKLFDCEYLTSISVQPPIHWSEIFQSLDRFEAKNSKNSIFSLFPELDCFLCMCQGSYCYLLLRSVFCLEANIDLTKHSNGFMQKLADCMVITKDSLTLNFFDFFALPKEKEFYSFMSIVAEHFSHLQLKRLSISNFESGNDVFKLIHDIIEIHRYSLVELTLANIFSTQPYFFNYFWKKRLHLQNIEKLVILNCNLRVQKKLSGGTKLKWIEADGDFTPALLINGEKVIFYEGYQGFGFNNRPSLHFLQTHKNLECSAVNHPNAYESISEIAAAYKAMKNLKKFTHSSQPIQNFIGSRVLESLKFETNSFFRPNCAFIKTLKKLVHLEIQNSFNPNADFWEFLELDRLESLMIANYNLNPTSNERLYQVLGQLKKLRILKVPNNYAKNPALSKSVEIFSLYIQEDENKRIFNNLQFQNYLLTALPFGPGVKYLQIDSNVCSGTPINCDLTNFYPQLVRMKCKNCSFTLNPKYNIDESKRPLCDGLPERFEI